jgi:serine/threonine protein kinase
VGRRLPSQPPTLPGFSFVRILGSGGFADVFLYEQDSPRRQVAVKVMLAEYVNNHVRQMFAAEADLMAQLSAHPSILTVYQSGVAGDGRPYLVMELCSQTLGTGYRNNRLSAAEALRVGIKIGGAAESAHRTGVLHRDIKPSNILMTAYGNPVLSDFGIAGAVDEIDDDAVVGMSVPWTAAEVLRADTNGTIASEVFSLGATVYTLLAGRSPFEIEGGDNSSAQLMSRINRGVVTPIGRDDVPENLERVLRKSLARTPEKRHRSAMEFIRELQAVEASMGLAQTQPDVSVDDWADVAPDDPDDRTRVNPIRDVQPVARRRRARGAPVGSEQGQDRLTARESATGTGGTPARTSAGAGEKGDVGVRHRASSTSTRARGGTAAANSRSGRRGTATAGPGGSPAPTPSWRSGRWFVAAIVACAVLVLALAATAVLVVVRAGSAEAVPAVSNVVATSTDGSLTFSWPDPGIRDDDVYEIEVDDSSTSTQRSTTFVVAGEPGDTVCVTVRVNRAGSLGARSPESCGVVPEAGSGTG